MTEWELRCVECWPEYTMCTCPPPPKFPQVPYGDAPQLFSPEQVMAMLMTYLKKVAETALNKPVGDCVVSVSLHSS